MTAAVRDFRHEETAAAREEGRLTFAATQELSA